MVKSYLRYEERAAFGLIASAEANLCFNHEGKLLLCGALEQLQVWNVRLGECTHALAPTIAQGGGARPAVTSISIAPSSLSQAAVGYSDGSLRIWDFVKGTCESTMNGHRGAVVALRYNKSGSMIVTGSKDTDVILWDAVAETGLYRLKGHRDQVTDVLFLEKGRRLVSSSKDNFVRVWDIETQACIQTLVNHRSEVWSLDVDPSERYLVTGGAEPELRLFSISEESQDDGSTTTATTKKDVLKFMGEIRRQSSDRVVTLRFNHDGTLLGCQGAGKSMELYSINDDADAVKKAKKRKRRRREKVEKSGVTIAEADDVPEPVVASDVLHLLQIIRLKQKVRSFSYSPVHAKKGLLETIAFSMHNNSLEVFEVEKESSSRVHTVDLQGHRSDVRSAVLSKDGTLLMTTSHDSVKIWNPRTSRYLKTIESGYGLCGTFGFDDNHSIVGTKEGMLEFFDIRAAQRCTVVEAHSGAVWSIAAMPDGTGFITGSADHDVKFWEYEIVQENEQAPKHLSARNKSTIKMTEDVLAVCLSPDGKFFAVALLDSTVQIFFTDSKKFYLSLYGHKLPVLCMDISSDGTLLASGSADKNIKIWGMDFGDCHKSLFAHGDSVTAIKFVPKTHYMFSVGKDRLVKYWDADKFEHLLTLEGHHAEVWCLAVSTYGEFVVTGSHDRSIRRWERTDEPFFIEEEREKRLEEMFEAELDDTKTQKDDIPEEGATGLAGRRTQGTVSAVDSIIEALDISEEEQKRIEEHKNSKTKFQPNLLMLGHSPSAYVFRAVSSVRPSDLEQALLMLPFPDALKLLEYVKDWMSEGNQVETACRVVTLLLRLHHTQLVATAAARPVVAELHTLLHLGVEHLKDIYGFNLAAMGHLQQLMESGSNALFKDAGNKLVEIRKKLSLKRGGVEQPIRKKKRQKVTQQ